MRRVYNLVLYLLVPWVLARLAWRGRKVPGYRHRWGERFGFYPLPPMDACLWVHAVSVGEVQAAVPLVRALLERYPRLPLLLTTMTPTGSQRVRDLFGDRVLHVYVPYDLPGAVARFLDRMHPHLAVIMETELWPNLFRGCANRGVPVVVANARLSARSTAGYQKLHGLTAETLADVSVLAAQGEVDAERFRNLGMPPGGIQVTGSIKFELKLPASLREQAEVLRGQLGRSRPVWIAASTHEGEDEQVLEALALLRRSIPDCLLVLVPRHPERFDRVVALCKRRGLKIARRSQDEFCDSDCEVYVGDTLGDLPLLYAASDVAFVGGSLVDIGGHNMLEPAALGVPIITGPRVHNFEEITRMLIEVEAARMVRDAQQLAGCVESLMRDANGRHRMGENGRGLVEANRGALEKLLAIVAQRLG